MCTAFMAGVLTGYALSKCTQETPPLKTFAGILPLSAKQTEQTAGIFKVSFVLHNY